MKRILTFIFALNSFFASSQTQFLGAPNTTVVVKGNMKVDSILYLPKRSKTPTDTGALRYQISDSSLYVWTGNAWRKAKNDGTVTSVGLTMPSAFAVANSPVTGAGTLAVTATGTVSEYIRGDGTLGTLPSSGGGGGSGVNYYLNGSVSQGTIGGSTYYEMNKTPIIGAGTDFSRGTDGIVAQFITDANDPNRLLIPAGAWNFELYFSASSAGGTPSFYIELFEYDGTNFTSIASSVSNPISITNGTAVSLYVASLAVPETVLTATDRLSVRISVNVSGRTITLHTEDNNLAEVITTFSGGLVSLNGLTANDQFFTTGTSGSDFNISSTSATHTFNLPTASSTVRGALSSANWTTFNNKVNISDTATMLTNYIRHAGNGLTKTGQALSVDTASIATRARVQKGIDSVASVRVGGTGTTNYIPKFTGASTLGNSQIFDNGTNVIINGTGNANSLLAVQSNDAANISSEFLIANNASGGGSIRLMNARGTVASPTQIFPSARLGGFFFSGYNGSSYVNSSAITSIASDTFTATKSGSFIAFETTLNNTNTRAEKVRISNDGILAVNTISPTSGYKLHVAGDLRIANEGSESGAIQISNAGSIGLIQTRYSQPLVFGTSASGGNMRITATGDVAIGNTSPSYKLDVSGTLRNTTGAAFATSSGNVLVGKTVDAGVKLDVVGSIANTTGANFATSSGNVGIGAPPFSWSLGKILDINNGIGLLSLNTSGEFASNLYFDGAWKHKATGGGAKVVFNSGNIGDVVFSSAPSASAGANATLTTKLQIFATGQIANFGTASATVPTFVNNGTMQFQTSTIPTNNPNSSFQMYAERIGTGTNAVAHFRSETGVIAIISEKLGTKTRQNLSLSVSDTNRVVIDTFSRVGINTTTPTENLDVNGRTRIRTIDSTATGMNMLYADATGVIKKAAVPSGGSGTVTSVATGFGLSGGTITTSGTIAVDTASIATRARVQKGIDSVASLTTAKVGGTGISGYFPKWTGASSQDTSQLFQLGRNIGIGTATPTYRIHLPDAGNVTGQAMIAGTVLGSDGNGQTIRPSGSVAMALFGQNDIGYLYGAAVSSTGRWGINTRSLNDATLSIDGSVKIVTIDSTSTARNMLYQDANGVIKKSAVPTVNNGVINTSIAVASANYTVTSTDHFVYLGDLSSAGRNIVLPNDAVAGRQLIFFNTSNDATYKWTFTNEDVQDITGAAVTTLTNRKTYMLVFYEGVFHIISEN